MDTMIFFFRNELYADFFDEGEKNEEGLSKFTKKPQIRFSRDRGISGYVARTGEVRRIMYLLHS